MDFSRNKLIGFTTIELLLALVVVISIFIGVIHYTALEIVQIKGFNVAEDAIDYANEANRYIKTHYSTLAEALTINGQGNALFITVPIAVLKKEGFIKHVSPDTNLLKQYPCLVLTYSNNQIEAFVYYRSNGNSQQLTQAQLTAGLEHVGGMIGIYHNGIVNGAGNIWRLTADDTNWLFKQQGDIYPNNGTDLSSYKCQGSMIDNNSYVINLASITSLNNHLPNGDVLNQYPDPKAPLGEPSNTNTMNTNLNMDNNGDKQSIIFQMNQNCVMDPNHIETMQDYDAKVPGDDTTVVPNDKGCRNRQLSLIAGHDMHGTTMMVTGFRQGGVAADFANYNKNNRGFNLQQPYVGTLKAKSFQPTAEVAVGTPCDAIEVGKMGRQLNTGEKNDINNLYISQVQCMQNPLCPETTHGYCYMPINSLTIVLHPNSRYAECPIGTAVANFTDNVAAAPDHSECCQQTIFGCSGTDDMHDHVYDGPEFTYLNKFSPQVLPFESSVTLGIIHYKHTCPAQCVCPTGDGWTWQPLVTSITCSNDASKLPISINVN